MGKKYGKDLRLVPIYSDHCTDFFIFYKYMQTQDFEC